MILGLGIPGYELRGQFLHEYTGKPPCIHTGYHSGYILRLWFKKMLLNNFV